MKVLVLILVIAIPAALFSANPGDVIITEIMKNPDAVSDTYGEWFELYNITDQDIDINGWTIKDAGSNVHVIDNGGSLWIPAKGFCVLGRNGDANINGDYTCNYVYSSFVLSNGEDEIILIDSENNEIDRVEYLDDTNWPTDQAGASLVLADLTSDNNNGSNWIYSTTRQPSFTGETGDLGSPGSLGTEQTLPVTLLSFTASIGQDGVLLKWRTGLEIDNLGFKVQRTTGMNQAYQTISELIPGNGNSTSAKVFQYLDNSALPGNRYYYRIADIAFDGSITYHPSIEVNYGTQFLPKDFKITGIYPNPFHRSKNGSAIQFKLDVPNSGLGEKIELTVYNLLGQKVAAPIQFDGAAGSRVYSWQVKNNLPTGIYFLRVQYNNLISQGKFLLME